MSSPLSPSPRTTLRRLPQRAGTERAALLALLDEALVVHVGFVDQGQPFVIPTLLARRGEQLYLHGSSRSRMLEVLGGGAPCCLTVTSLDGLVLARSAFHHSVNYRSAVVLGQAREVEGDEKLLALEALVERVSAGRWSEVRPPSATELLATRVLAVSLEEASLKTRSGGPKDDDEDYALPCWAGVLPLRTAAGEPVPDERLAPGTPPPPGLTAWRR